MADNASPAPSLGRERKKGAEKRKRRRRRLYIDVPTIDPIQHNIVVKWPTKEVAKTTLGHAAVSATTGLAATKAPSVRRMTLPTGSASTV